MRHLPSGALVDRHAALLLDVQRGAAVVAEVKLGRTAVKVVHVAVLLDALHALPKHGEEAFDGVDARLINGKRSHSEL
jgi:hypothetical protein